MTAIFYKNHDAEASADVQAWRCASCHCYHLRAGEALLTFTTEEFVAFMQEIVDCYCGQILSGEAGDAESDEKQTLLLMSEKTN
jgi:hypothetical protein